MSRPDTLSSAAERIRRGVAPSVAIPEFLDMFYGHETEARMLMLRDEPPPTGDARVDALMGAVCEYLAKRYGLAGVPGWASGADRFLAEPWFTTESADPGAREYLTFASPAEFSRRNIFTEAVPLRRASQAPRRGASA